MKPCPVKGSGGSAIASDTYFGAAQTLQRPSSGYEPQTATLKVKADDIAVRSDQDPSSNMTDLKKLAEISSNDEG